MSDAPLIIVGAGGHGRVVADAALEAGRRVLAFVDAQPRSQELLGIPVHHVQALEIPAFASQLGAEVVVAIGDNWARKAMQEALVAAAVPLASVLHPSSVVAKSALLGSGVMILAGAVVGVAARIGDGSIINTGARIDHDGAIGAFSHLSPGATLGGEVTVGEGTHLAVGVSVRNRVSIGCWSLVGVGAAVVKDLPERVMAFGVPARVVGPWKSPR
jgi:sugar O-acyltransferase (sialic acid O-acetyltransferase NeuD family)